MQILMVDIVIISVTRLSIMNTAEPIGLILIWLSAFLKDIEVKRLTVLVQITSSVVTFMHIYEFKVS